jgi:hypothetical protein
LLDNPAAKVGIDQATRSRVNRPTQNRIGDPGFAGKPRERLVLEYPHSLRSLSSRGLQPQGQRFTNIALGVIYYKTTAWLAAVLILT